MVKAIRYLETAASGAKGADALTGVWSFIHVADEPVPVSEWLPALAVAVGAKPPQVRGASNAKARRELGWRPTWPSYRDGFRKGLARAGL